jgi:PAS domain S-box-containing protein
MDKLLGFPGKSRATRAARRFDALLLASASIVWWTNAAGEFVEEQPYWQEYTGQSWDEHRGSGWASCLHPDDRQSTMADWTSAVASGSPYFAQGRIWSAKHKDYRAFQMRSIPIWNERGQIDEWLGALTDVQDTIDIKVLLDRTQTDLADSLKALRASEARSRAHLIERHRNDEALHESEERYKGIYQHASMGIAIWDLDGRMVSCNPAYCNMRGYSEDELRGLSFEAIVHPEDRERHACEVKKLISQRIPSFEIENRCLAKDGKVSWVHKHVSLLRDGAGRAANIITLATNVTERKQHEEQIDLLLREVNHRSKNLLSLVQAIAQQTVKTRPDDFLPRFHARVQALAASHDILVGNKWKGADLHELARSQLAHFRDLMDKRIALTGPPVFASASAAQALGMAFHELATNATKYGALSDESGCVELGWKTQQSAAGEEVFVIEWIERGGPPVAAPSSRGFGSTVICRLAERSLDAKVELNFPSTGLTWRLQCPRGVVEERAASAMPKPKAPEQQQDASERRLRVLVVEDEVIVAFEIEQNLRDAGFEVVGPAARVAEALELLQEFGCDAAVLDINLGTETSEPIALLLSEKGIPFVTVSGYSQDQRPSGFSGGAFLTKPLRAELLVALLRQCTAQQARGLRSN